MTNPTPVLHIGNKNYSSWSLRPWLALRWAGVAFEDHVIQLGGMGYGKSQIPEVMAISPSGRVPALTIGDVTIWDSLAICEWAAEQAPGRLLPVDPMVRAVCRSVVAEMHSGFAAVRRDMSMNIRRRTTPRDWPEDTRADLARIEELWTATRARYGGRDGNSSGSAEGGRRSAGESGPFLFGHRTMADAFFAPVVTRFRTYGVPLSASSAAYSEAVLADPDFRDWEAAAIAEPWTLPSTDVLLPTCS